MAALLAEYGLRYMLPSYYTDNSEPLSCLPGALSFLLRGRFFRMSENRYGYLPSDELITPGLHC